MDNASSIDRSISSPPGSRRRPAARVEMAPNTPETHSPIWPPTKTGARSGLPRANPTTPPDHAWSVNSVAGLSFQGPSRPNGVIAVTVRCGCLSRISRGASAGCSATEEPRDHTTASADASSVSSAARLSARSTSTTTLCFEALRKLKSAPSASGAIAAPEADQRRSGSPSGDSTLMTSAPPSANSFVQYAPPIQVDRSMTRRLLKGDAAGASCAAPSCDAATVSRCRGAGDRSRSGASQRGTCCHCPSPRG